MRQIRAAILAALFLSVQGAGPVAAQEVTLTSRDGAVSLSGELLGFDGQFYRLRTIYGELTVDGTKVLCEGDSCPSIDEFVAELTVSGSTSANQVLMPALLKAFALRRGFDVSETSLDERSVLFELTDPGEDRVVGRFTFRAGSTDEGFADLLASEADIVLARREIREDEIDRGRAAGLGVLDEANRSRMLALDALVPVVAPANAVSGVSLRDLAGILGGDVTSWEELGGPAAPIALHVLDDDSGLTQGLVDRLLGPSGGVLPPMAVRHPTNASLAGAVASDPFALGIASYSGTGNTRMLPVSGPCGFVLTATRRSVKTEDYPLTAPIFLYLPARRLPELAREFLAFTRSEPAQIVIRRAGFVDQAPEEVPIDRQGDRFANAISVAPGEAGLRELKRMVATLRPMQRLSTSFRFEPGSARLDAQSRSNVYQLAHAIETGLYDARRLVFVGFSDGVGSAAANLDIARERAAAVMGAVIRAAETADLARVTISSEAFGEAMPMACDATEWGRGVNRRVEVWVR
ncbi:cell envelope biogenesis protein OmpA [Roseivivax halodurans JCM 10272]|uniref:Cell envelope biogenesis protein OmpA n=1 Tax=Roseivivax halodurans JCM 10272 TaxID=1449350 RepID=X7EIK2_9RHOB|nr:phosphate ABC transporter substrate-binding/OmpA family protein [Roseivivax halodurans]ETX15720.1 cell envelope biogenesis protein OmpA [Roseivivax halodurans JCM 10272]